MRAKLGQPGAARAQRREVARRGAARRGVGRGGAARELALGQREVGAADARRLARREDARDRGPHVLVVGDGVAGELAAERARQVDRGEEAVGGADGVDLEGPLGAGRGPVRAGRRDRGAAHPLVAVGAHDHVSPHDPADLRAVLRVVEQALGVGGHPRPDAGQSRRRVASATATTLGSQRGELRGDRQQERPGSGEQDPAAGNTPWPFASACAPPAVSTPGKVQPGKATGRS